MKCCVANIYILFSDVISSFLICPAKGEEEKKKTKENVFRGCEGEKLPTVVLSAHPCFVLKLVLFFANLRIFFLLYFLF